MSKETANWHNFGLWVVERRQRRGLTQEGLADLVGLDRQQVYRIEKGGSTKRPTVIKIATALGENSDEALSIAFGLSKEPKSARETADQAGKRMAEMAEHFLSLTPENQATAIELIKVLKD